MPRRAGTTTTSRRGALQAVDTNELPPADEALKAKKMTVSGAKAKELLCSIEEKEQENQALKSKTLELEDQVAALTEQLNSVQINASKPTVSFHLIDSRHSSQSYALTPANPPV
mmetsp:Transcript_36658/g.146537  ORF Transcript_36658/g.146537 Transcript_36658/m.146537 type:complete len:114 (-) Transcript_36658:3084-3425(-)